MTSRGGISSIFDRRDTSSVIPIVIPPFDQANIILAFDPDGSGNGQYLTGGPIPTVVGSAPSKTQGAPSYYSLIFDGTGQGWNFGDILDNIFTSPTNGFSFYACISIDAALIASGNNYILLSKWSEFASLREWGITVGTNTVNWKLATQIWYANDNLRTDFIQTTIGLTSTGRFVFAATFDPNLARSSRLKQYIGGSLDSTTFNTLGTDGNILDTSTPIKIGHVELGNDTSFPPQTSYAYIYKSVHSGATVTNISNWLINTKKWV